MTLLVAPAGAGKTLGIGGWLQLRSHESDAIWVYGDRLSDPEHLQRLLDDSQRTNGARPRLLVIDDAHLLPAASLRIIDDRLNNAPESMRLLLVSRWDLPLTRLVPELLGHFTILRGGVLRMDDDECASLIADHGRSTDPAVVEAITEYAQGWCAAVVLAARAVGAAPDPVAAARRYAERDSGVADRVASEVFSALLTRDRHVLLCVAPEKVVTAESAAHLSHCPDAGEVLSTLESTGLLVTRTEDPDSTGDTACYRIHPLLVEVIRRRLASGGVDVARARATVVRAVGLDVARGDLAHCFDRLVAVDEVDRAAELLAAYGVTLVTRGQGDAVAAFVRHRPEIIEAHPESWFPVALERWVVGDVDTARHWIDRALQVEQDRPRPDATDGDSPSWRVACLRLMRARLGLEPLDAAVESAQALVQTSPYGASLSVDQALLPQLLTELGITQNWTGDLPRAADNLTAAIGVCRTRNLPALAAAAASQLALTQYMAGRERACIEVAHEALEMLRSARWRSVFTRGRAYLALRLAGLSARPWQQLDDLTVLDRAHAADLCTQFWLRTYRARRAMIDRSVAEAERILTSPFELPVHSDPLPRHLQNAVLVERAFLAALASDPSTLKEIEHDLDDEEAHGEAALTAALRADLAGDRQGAARQLAAASRDASLAQPPTRALALACEAQILAALGDERTARDRLRAAVAATQVRCNAVPFLGWTRQGIPMPRLLKSVRAEVDGTAVTWCDELIAGTDATADMVTTFAPTTATARERAAVEDDTLSVLPTLSPREREVLLELGRGSTYADIAANLYVSENTVKTHVSSLYSKLAATRRSEALAMARRLGLL